MKPKKVIIWIVSIFVLIVLFQNMEVVAVRVLFWERSMSQILLMAIILIPGLVLGYLIGRLGRAAKRGGA